VRTPTNPSTLLVAAVAAGLATNLLLGLVYGDLPTFPVFAGVTLLLLGIAELVPTPRWRPRGSFRVSAPAGGAQ